MVVYIIVYYPIFYLLYAILVPRIVCINWTKLFGLENYRVPRVDSTDRVLNWRCLTDVPLIVTKEASYFIECTTRKAIDVNMLNKI